jgi:4-hydroxy-4-methyl-2-oxoglutarate aldolase
MTMSIGQQPEVQAGAFALGTSTLCGDGGLRDIAALARRRSPVISRGISVKGAIKASAPSAGAPILMTGVPIAAGELVIADDDGVVVVPVADVQRVMAAGEARADKEARMMEKLAQGATTVDLLGLSPWRKPA